MKTFFLLPIVFLGLKTIAQTEESVKLYAYKEPVIQGVSPKQTIDEQGRKISESGTTSFNYFIYLVSPSRVYAVEMWINGKPYSVNLERIHSTPVTREIKSNTAEPATVELVPASTGQVYLLKPLPHQADKETEDGRALASKHELVVVYRYYGKIQYKTLEKITVLEAAYMQ